MKNWKKGIVLLLLFLFLPGGKAYAGNDSFNLIKTMTAQPEQAGKWVKNKKGSRYRYTATKKYAKNTWLTAKGRIYFVNKQGYRITGFKKYKKNTYYLDEKGRLVTGWQQIDGERYYFSKKTGAMLTGWNGIGKKQYYFSEKGVLLKNTWIGDNYVGKKGYVRKAKRIFVGDSRTVGLQRAVQSSDTYVASWGQGYRWFSESGQKELEKILKENPYSAVILNLGVNDLANAESYLLAYDGLRQKYPKARFYFMSVNPVEETFLRINGFSGRDNASIEAFNERMKEAFGMCYIDTYRWMIEKEYVLDVPQGHGTLDGLHYIDIVYRMLYGYVTARAK